MGKAIIGLGSNLGDKIGYIQQAYRLLVDTEGITIIKSSSLYESEPVGYKEQDWFVNAVVIVETDLEPYDLLKECHRIEHQLGRERDIKHVIWGPRTIDLDILFYDNVIISNDVLQIPHSQVHLRVFTLKPILEIEPDYVHPVMNEKLSVIFEELQYKEQTRIIGQENND